MITIISCTTLTDKMAVYCKYSGFRLFINTLRNKEFFLDTAGIIIKEYHPYSPKGNAEKESTMSNMTGF